MVWYEVEVKELLREFYIEKEQASFMERIIVSK